MNTARKATPDSEAIVSSEDERPWPASTSFGSLPRKDSNVPGMPGGIWSTQRRGSLKIAETAQRNAAREAARLAAPNPAQHHSLRPGSSPSPSASETPNTMTFKIPLQPVPKPGRSLSYSQGQRELLQASRSANTPENAIPLGLLAEEGDTDSDSEKENYHHAQRNRQAPVVALQRVSTMPASYDTFHGHKNGNHFHNDPEDESGGPRDRHLEAAFAGLGFEQAKARTQWQSHLGWDDLPPVNESRRHSLAEIPTRRGSLDNSSPSPQLGQWVSHSKPMKDHLHQSHVQNSKVSRYETSIGDLRQFTAGNPTTARRASEAASNVTRFNDGNTPGEVYNIPPMYKVPFVAIDEAERNNPEDLRLQQQAQQTQQHLMRVQANNPAAFRPRKTLYVVSFKCSRVDVFYLLENTGLHVREGDIVIVEADRGQDLGTVQHANVTPDQARIYKRKYSEEQYKWLMMFSRNNTQGNVNPNAVDGYGQNGANNAAASPMINSPSAMQGLPRDNYNNLKPKAIKRLANPHEIKMLSEKEHNEAKAKRTCQQKVSHLHLQMEILDAEWQWDFQKLIFYYYADHYINFKDLITDLYRIYKTRIWLSAVNPASFSQHAVGQPPSGIGPGAITSLANGPGPNNTYAMSYGADPDPYGAVPPYRIGYETYTPNYPSIPGMTNSFVPVGANPTSTIETNGSPFVAASADMGAIQHSRFDETQSWYDRGPYGHQVPNGSFAARIVEQEQHGLENVNSPFTSHGIRQYPHNSNPNLPTMPTMPHPNPPQQINGTQSWSWQGGRAAMVDHAAPGRSLDTQAPIGTRPASNGLQSNAFATGSIPSALDTDFRDPFRQPSQPHLLRNKMIATPNHTTFPAGIPAGPESDGVLRADLPSLMPRGSVSSASNLRNASVSKQTQVKNYLSNLPDVAAGYADEMSRER